MATPKPVIVVGAGPVGLCLALALAQDGVAVTLVEQLSDDNFLDQVPRAGSNHPATLELFDRIGLYEKLVPRGIVAPKFHYWDRQEGSLIAEFDHTVLKNDTRFPFVLQCERIKIIEEALEMAKAHPLIEVRMATTFTGFEQDADGVTAARLQRRGETETIRGSYLVSAEGARSVVRKDLDVEFEGFTYPERTLNIEVAYDFKKHGYTERNYISDPVEYSNLFHWKGPPDRWRIHFPTDPNEDESALTRPEAMQARLKRFLPLDRDFEICGCNLYAVHQRVAKTVPRRPRHPGRRQRPCEQPDRRHGAEQRRARRVQPGGQADPDLAWRSRRDRARPLRAATQAYRREAHPGTDHPQQAAP